MAVFSIENFLSHSAENFRRASLLCVTNFGYHKFLCFRELYHDFLSNFFVSHCRKNSKGNPSLLCFGKFPVSNRIMDKKVWRVSKFSVENFLSHSAEKCSRGTL